MEEDQDDHKNAKRMLDEEAIPSIRDANNHSKRPRLDQPSSSSLPVTSAAQGCLVNSIEEENEMHSAPSPSTIQPVAEQYPNNEQWRLDPYVGNKNLQPAYPHQFPLEQPRVDRFLQQRRLDPSVGNYNLQPSCSHRLPSEQLFDKANTTRSASSPNMGSSTIQPVAEQFSKNEQLRRHLFEENYNAPIPPIPPHQSSVPSLLPLPCRSGHPATPHFDYDISCQNTLDGVLGRLEHFHPFDPQNALVTSFLGIANPCAASGTSRSSGRTFNNQMDHHQTSNGEQQPRPVRHFVRASGTREMNSPAQDGTYRATASDNRAQNAEHGSSNLEESNSNYPPGFKSL